MHKLDLTILIPCASDIRIERCIQNIYQTCNDDVEILVSLNNATDKVKRLLGNFLKVRTCEIKDANLSKAYNNGIEHASRNNILLMDSDCIFGPATIKLLYDGLNYAKLSKGLVIFQNNSLMSRAIARVREYTTTDFINAFSPPLAFSKSIKDTVGGYYFHEQVPWSEDSEFNYRVQRAGLKIHYNPEAVIYHAPLTIKHDTRSGFRYGEGKQISMSLNLLPRRKYFKLSTHIEKYWRTYEVFVKKGLLPALYYFLVWRPINRIGYLFQGLRIKIKT